jgi:predicted nucleic acid-binding protein
MTENARPTKVYIDTNVFIYFVEFNNELHDAAKAWISDFEREQTQIIVSRLTYLECIYGPSKAGSSALVEVYRSMLTDNPSIQLVEMANDILEAAALNGGNLGLKLPDAIHYFTALHIGCDLFLTNDRRFKSTRSMRAQYMTSTH